VFPDELVGEFCRNNLPWTSAACFDRSIITGDFRDYTSLLENATLTRSYTGTEEAVAQLPSAQEIATAIHEVSRYNSLKMGDFILIPLAFERVKLFIDSYLTISSGREILLNTAIK
ncbi:MAG: hypothetical protein K2G23_04515, partial [Muribaculaceae bacterium]|nr:hypothetical protein [Muribaculaceae bacterium]